MKHIIKKPEPESFLNWKYTDVKVRRGNAKWSRLSGAKRASIKQELLESLCKEQGYICCYCESKLIKKPCGQNDFHIEHIISQNEAFKNNRPELIFDYNNLLCSCQCNQSEDEDHQCGMSKGNWHSDDMVTPLQSDCETRFRYTKFGKIKPLDKDDKGAQETIEKLNLNAPILVSFRLALMNYMYYSNSEILKRTTDDRIKLEYRSKDERKNKFNLVQKIPINTFFAGTFILGAYNPFDL